MVLWEKIADCEKRLQDANRERQKLHETQQQIQGNMGALSDSGTEPALRAWYFKRVEETEDQLQSLIQREADLSAEMQRLRVDVDRRLQALG